MFKASKSCKSQVTKTFRIIIIKLIFIVISDSLVPLSCTGHPCVNGATCVETSDSYHCKCSSGYKGLKCSGMFVRE